MRRSGPVSAGRFACMIRRTKGDDAQDALRRSSTRAHSLSPPRATRSYRVPVPSAPSARRDGRPAHALDPQAVPRPNGHPQRGVLGVCEKSLIPRRPVYHPSRGLGGGAIFLKVKQSPCVSRARRGVMRAGGCPAARPDGADGARLLPRSPLMSMHHVPRPLPHLSRGWWRGYRAPRRSPGTPVGASLFATQSTRRGALGGTACLR